MTTTEQQEKPPQEQEFLIRGIVPNPYFPSESLLMVDLDVTSLFTDTGADYIDFKQGLEDRLNALDLKYARSAGRLKGRRVTANYKTMFITLEGNNKPTKIRGRVLQVMPYPSVYSSRLAELRTDFYGGSGYVGILHKNNAVPLSYEQHGRRRFVTYFLSEGDASHLQLDVDELNDKVDELNEDITKFEQTSDFSAIVNYLLTKIPNVRWSRQSPIHSQLHQISLNFTPLPISRQLVETYMDQDVKAEVKKNLASAVQSITENIQGKLGELVTVLATLLSADLHDEDVTKLNARFAEIRKQAKEYQVANIVSKQFDICQALMEAIQTKDPFAIQQSAEQVAGTLNLRTEGLSAASILKDAASKLKKVDPETAAYIDAIF